MNAPFIIEIDSKSKDIDFELFSRNGENVEGATHKQVVDYIKSGGDKLTLTGKAWILMR